jgi:hypothetical protein
MSKHTPGPWRSEEWSIHSGEIGINFLTVAKCSEVSGIWKKVYIDHDEVTANARLIAAAPELLEAIKAMVPYFCPDETADDCKIKYLEVLDLIAKAERGSE